MSYTLGEAARAAGTSKTTIRRALDSGRISGTKNSVGEWMIEPVELHRVFPRNSDVAQETARSVTPDGTGGTPVLEAKLEAATQLNEELRGQIEDLREERTKWQQQAERLTTLLTDQRARPEPSADSVTGRLSRAWAILRGKEP